MLKYIFRKVLLTLPLLFGVITLIFVLLELAPGDITDRFITQDTTPEVAAALRAKWHLDDPVWVRYLHMIKNVAVLDFGVSMKQDRPVFDVIMEALPNTILLSLTTLVFLYPLGIVMGTWQGVRAGKVDDTSISISSLFFYSMPGFWLAMMLQLILAYHLDLFPLDGMESDLAFTYTPTQKFFDLLWHLALPGAAMGIAWAAGIARYMRSSLLEVVGQDYIRTARAKGLPERTVVGKHALRNALLPIITIIGLSLRFLFSGAVLIEIIFSWPGMGRLIVDAIFSQDTPLIIACFFVSTLIVVAGNLMADIAYAFVDPRIRYD